MSVRVGVINLMPKAETYEQMLRAALARTLDSPREPPEVELSFIRITSHRYGSSDAQYLHEAYQSYEQTLAVAPLRGLILTGAPVEQLAFEDVHYWSELRAVLNHADQHIPKILGLCWGGMVLAQRLGIGKVTLAQKLFGLYPMLRPQAPTDAGYCAQSRHAGLDTADVVTALRSGRVRSLAYGDDTGHTLLESRNQRVLMHLGHPEYTVERLAYEYTRDLAAGRAHVAAPVGLAQPEAVEGHARHRAHFFGAWLRSLVSP